MSDLHPPHHLRVVGSVLSAASLHPRPQFLLLCPLLPPFRPEVAAAAQCFVVAVAAAVVLAILLVWLLLCLAQVAFFLPWPFFVLG